MLNYYHTTKSKIKRTRPPLNGIHYYTTEQDIVYTV